MMNPIINSSISPSLLITIFVPVFNGEKYLNETLSSIKNQTYYNIEVLLVDDSSTDESKIILDKFAKEDNRFKVFVKENGGMVSVSWNYIIPKIKGDFVFYTSQDDIFSIDLIEKMVAKQQETNADAILPDMEYYFENRQNNKKTIGFNGNRNVVLTGRNAFEASLNWEIHGFALLKSSLIIEEFFPEDAFDSDDFMTRKLYLKSNKVVFCEGTFFYRQDNPQAITKTFSKKNFYTLNSAFRLYHVLEDNNFDKNSIINVQFALLLRHLQLTSICQLYHFDSPSDRTEIAQYLTDFKQKHFTPSFYFSNLCFAILNLKLRFIILLLVCKIDIVFKITAKTYSKSNTIKGCS
ncbi:glycosyltransferase family 2 protein [Flavobacterium sp.]|uniref:glycosyltransferase family 2 protein n=1 Tax=Flavobacterium sp. TaxID=239 RepID=UPI00286E3078|nr:glycosyltransferase family 2 protein [Flavobacterium sp.]